MQVKNENVSKNELTGEFVINKKYCFCCSKEIKIYFFMTKDKLLFYYDDKKTKLYKEILRTLVLAINHRFRTEQDKHKISIYYLEKENSLIIKELKLKASTRNDTDKWIHILNKKIKPKRFEFPTLSNNYIKANNIFHFKNNCDFYVELSKLEYILLKNKFRHIFEIYRNTPKYQNSTNNSNENELLNKK